MRKYLVLLVLFLTALVAQAQYSTGSGTITDHNGTVWNGATVTATFYPSPNFTGNYTWNGQTQKTFAPVVVTANASGVFSIQVPDNSLISPAKSMWVFTFCPLASAVCNSSVPVSMVGGSVALSTLATTTITPPSINPTGIQYAYNDAEVLPMPGLGQLYFRTSDLTLREWNGIAWVAAGNSGTVNSGLAGQLATYVSSGNAVSGLALPSITVGNYINPTISVDQRGLITSISSALPRINGCTARYAIIDTSGTTVPNSCPDTIGTNDATLPAVAPTIGSFGALFIYPTGATPPETITTPLKNWSTVIFHFCTWPRGGNTSIMQTTTGISGTGKPGNEIPVIWGASASDGLSISSSGWFRQVIGAFGGSSATNQPFLWTPGANFRTLTANQYGNCHVEAAVADVSADRFYIDGQLISNQVTAGSASLTPTTTNYDIGATNNLSGLTGWRGWINYFEVYPTELTDSQILTESLAISNIVSNRPGYPVIPYFNISSRTPTVTFLGDSLFAGFNAGTSWTTAPYFVPTNTYTVQNYGLIDQKAHEIAALFDFQDSGAIAPSARSVVFMNTSTNDLTEGYSVPDTYSAIRQEITKVLQAGAIPIYDTMISRVGEDANKDLINPLIINGWRQSGAVAINDVAELASIGADGAYANTSALTGCFNVDQIHLGTLTPSPANCSNGHAGYALYAQSHADTLNYVDGSTFSSPTPATSFPFTMTYGTVYVSPTCASGTCSIILPGCDHMDDMPFYVLNYGNAGTVTVTPPASSFYLTTQYLLNGSSSAVTIAPNTTAKFNELRGTMAAGGCQWIQQD